MKLDISKHSRYIIAVIHNSNVSKLLFIRPPCKKIQNNSLKLPRGGDYPTLFLLWSIGDKKNKYGCLLFSNDGKPLHSLKIMNNHGYAGFWQ
jgi:hypothetical protein